MQIKEALTFDDILLVPNKSNILPNEANTQTLITSRISLNSPIISSAMDTVTESRMAIALAEVGGIVGIDCSWNVAESTFSKLKLMLHVSSLIFSISIVFSSF